jgi:gliding motility-associated-like protein
LPLIDKPANRTECSSYTLPPLTNGNYFSSPRGVGPLFAGNIITSTKTIYVYALGANRCPNEHSFIVDIIPLPALPNFTNIFTCTSFRLPFLRDGSYYSAPNGPNGVGVLIPFDTEIKTSQTIYVYNESAIDKTCRNESFFDIEAFNVNVGTFTDVSACDSYILPSLAEGDYYLLPDGQGNTIPAGTAITETQTLYVYKKEGNRQTCSDEDSFIVTINKTPFLIDAPDIIACGSYILPVLSVGNYFSGPNGTGKAYFAGDEIKTSEQMYIYASSVAGSCIDEDLFKIDVYPLNVLSIKDSIICVNNITKSAVNPYYINTQLDPIIYDVEWYLDGKLVGTGIDFLVEMEGKYEVKFIKKTIDTINDCGYSNSTFTVRKSSPAIAKAVVKSDFASTVAIVVELIGGFGNYSYQLDGGPFQTSNVFNDVSSGAHTIVVADLEAGCETLTLNAYVIKYPRFFTPNEDTYNDTWNISDLANNPNSTIYIYDRFGKLIKQVSPSGLGWDGTYNGEELPSTDYWFQVFYDVNGAKQEFKAHFSLVR